MSGLVDKRTEELSKLKGQTQIISSNGSSPIHHDSRHGPQEKEMSSTGSALAVARFIQVNKPRMLFSEDSVSMLVERFSP